MLFYTTHSQWMAKEREETLYTNRTTFILILGRFETFKKVPTMHRGFFGFHHVKVMSAIDEDRLYVSLSFGSNSIQIDNRIFAFLLAIRKRYRVKHQVRTLLVLDYMIVHENKLSKAICRNQLSEKIRDINKNN